MQDCPEAVTHVLQSCCANVGRMPGHAHQSVIKNASMDFPGDGLTLFIAQRLHN